MLCWYYKGMYNRVLQYTSEVLSGAQSFFGHPLYSFPLLSNFLPHFCHRLAELAREDCSKQRNTLYRNFGKNASLKSLLR